MNDPWTIYWQADNRDSCIASDSAADAAEIRRFWQAFAATLEPRAAVLDLATGNGAVPYALLQGNKTLNVTGVDYAEIDPARFLSGRSDLDGVHFMGGVNVCELPFQAETFDAVTSQFGIEYAPLAEAVTNASHALKRGGKLRLLMHHAEGAVVGPTKIKLSEMAELLQPGGVIERLSAYIESDDAIEELEAAGQRHLSAATNRTASVSGQIFAGVNRVIQSKQSADIDTARALATNMSVRLRADHDRLSQLAAAALTQAQLDELTRMLAEQSINVEVAAPLTLHAGSGSEALIGWHLDGLKEL